MKTMQTNRAKIMQALTCILLLTVLSISAALCQVPACFNYQAVLRDAGGAIISEETVSIDVSILSKSPTGTSVYSEIHEVTTSSMGLVNLMIGSKDSSTFNGINWADGPYFIKVKVDETSMGTSQLLSVPFAKYADKVVNVNANKINEGTISTDRYSAYDDLEEEDRLNADNTSDILLAYQADLRYNLKIPFHARNSIADSYTDLIHKIEFNSAVYNDYGAYSTSNDRYTAAFDGIYNFSASVTVSVDDGKSARLYCYVNGDPYCILSSGFGGNNYLTLTGTVTLKLNYTDYVEIWIETTDNSYSVQGSDTDFLVNPTHFSGFMLCRLY